MTDEQKKVILDNIKSVFAKHFPNSRVDVWGSWGTYNVRFFLSKDNTEVANQIPQNDCVYTTWSVDINDDKIEMELVSGGYVLRKTDAERFPNEKYLAYGSETFGFRKITAKPFDFCGRLNKFIVNKMCKVLLENADLINNGIVENLFDVRDKIIL